MRLLIALAAGAAGAELPERLPSGLQPPVLLHKDHEHHHARVLKDKRSAA